MKKLINDLRNQPEDTRTHVLHLIVLIAGIILFTLWVFSFSTNIASEETQTNIKNDTKPFAALKDNLMDGYNSISQ